MSTCVFVSLIIFGVWNLDIFYNIDIIKTKENKIIVK